MDAPKYNPSKDLEQDPIEQLDKELDRLNRIKGDVRSGMSIEDLRQHFKNSNLSTPYPEFR